MEHFGDLRGILQYVPQFRGRVFVVAVDGAVVASPNFSNVLLDLAVLHSLNIKVVLVFGAGAQVAKLAADRGVEPSDTEGLGRTDEATLQVSIDAITRTTNDIMQALASLGLRAAVTNALAALPAGVVGGVDLEFTGRVGRVAKEDLETFLSQGMIPLMAPLGYDRKGGTLRLNSDACAAEVAVALGASKLIYLSRDAFGTEPRQLPVEDAEAVAAGDDVFSEGFRSKLKHGARACRNGVARAHIIDGSVSEPLLRELFSNEGIATMVYVDTYLRLRQAEPSDAAEILALIAQPVADGELVRRTRKEVLERVSDYLVAEVDGNVVGTVAVHVYDPDGIAELACLFIKGTHGGQGYGRRLVAFAEKVARERGATRLVALSTQASGFFVECCGFQVGTDADLPEQRREKLAKSGRNSKVLFRELV